MATAFFGLFKRTPLFIDSFKDKHFFITGGSSGIGLALARKVIADGGYVTITGRDETKLAKADQILKCVVREEGNSPTEGSAAPRAPVSTKVVDVRDYDSMVSAMKDVPIDVLVCNAGVTNGGFLDKTSKEDIEMTVLTNVLGVMYTVRAALPSMKARSADRPCSIVIIGSLASMFCMYGHGVYTATKYAVKGYAECLRLELLPYRIRVSLICPGYVKTPFLDDAEKDPEVTSLMADISKYDRNKADTPENVAELIKESIRKGKFLVTNVPSGHVLFVLSRGFFPSESFVQVLLEAFFFFPLRILSVMSASRIKKLIMSQCRSARL